MSVCLKFDGRIGTWLVRCSPGMSAMVGGALQFMDFVGQENCLQNKVIVLERELQDTLRSHNFADSTQIELGITGGDSDGDSDDRSIKYVGVHLSAVGTTIKLCVHNYRQSHTV